MNVFKLCTELKPTGDQPEAIAQLTEGLLKGRKYQTLLGVTGSGKTFTMAQVIQNVQRPTLIISHNKTLAAQLYGEFKAFFPHNAVEYFISFYDYYQPEAYLPVTDTYIEKDSSINDEIDKLRLKTTSSLISRRDVIVVASVSCIYNIGSPEEYSRYIVAVKKGERLSIRSLFARLVDIYYARNDLSLERGKFRGRGDSVEIRPAYEDFAFRIQFNGDTVEQIYTFDTLTGEIISNPEMAVIYPAKHFISSEETIQRAIESISVELEERLAELRSQGKLLEAQRLEQRTRFDLEMIQEVKLLKRTSKLVLILILLYGFSWDASAAVKTGLEVLLSERLALIKGKRIGLITNPTGVNSQLVANIDLLKAQPEIKLVALFGPEHGVRGDVYAGEKVENYDDPQTGIPVYSLYGKTRKPTVDMLQNVDILIYDIQDIGNRTYTYIYTMALAMEAAREQNIPFIVLDRPNPLGGEMVEGPVLDTRFASFIGMYPIPYLYGLTVGELATYFNRELGINCNLTVIPMQGWRRAMSFDETGLAWVLTSPHIPHSSTALFCAITGCIGELNTVNIGVGYTAPFEFLGLPDINNYALVEYLNAQNLPGLKFRPLSYKPYYGNQQGQLLQGLQIHIIQPKQVQPMLTQLTLIEAILKLFPEKQIFNTRRTDSFDKACGTDAVRLALSSGKSAAEIYQSWQPAVQQFRQKCLPYLLYQ